MTIYRFAAAVSTEVFPNLTRASPEALEILQADVQRLAWLAYQEQGPDAFAAPRSAAAAHEAGHAVQYAAEGERVISIRTFSKYVEGARCWLGRTETDGPAWLASPLSEPAADLRRARITLAGALGELLLEGEAYRAGSSIDEVALARQLVLLAADKVGAPFPQLMAHQIGAVVATLADNWQVVEAISGALKRHRQIRGERLARLLSGVRPLIGSVQ